MTNQNSNEQQASSVKESSGDSSSDSRFNFMVTGLMVIIVVALSALWLTERAQRGKYQREGVQLKKALEEANARAMFAGLGGGTPVDATLVNKLQLMAAQSQEPQFEIVREELATVPMTVNGKPKQILQLSGTIGARAGFLPGDLIYITESPAKPAEK
jgi:flagellar biosynthesis/type III secretory pathway M-ring protein FliF/YscJ